MAKRVAYCAMFTALAMIFSYVEAMLPVNFGIPGVKLGIANTVVLTGLYILQWKEVLLISVLRVFLTAILFGNVLSAAYSLAGALCSFVVMLLMKKIGVFSVTGVSIAGGVSHNMGQLLVAVALVENIRLLFYAPVLLIAGTVTGFLIGITVSKIVPVINQQLTFPRR